MIAQPQSRQTNAPLTGRLRETAHRYQQILAQNPHHAEALAGMSLIALATRQHDAAVRMAQAAIATSPQMASAWVVLGQALRAANRPQESKDAYRTALHIDNNNALAHSGLGEFNITVGNPEEALQHFTRANEQNPNLTAARMGIGNAHACMDRFQEALTHYQAVLAQNPRLPEAHFAAGFALARLSKSQEAENSYRRAIALRPDFAAAWMNLGCMLREQGRDAYAEAALNRAVELRPDLIHGWINLALLKRELHRTSEAKQHLELAISLDPKRADTCIAWTQFWLAQRGNALRDIPRAWHWLNRAIEQEPDNAEAINMRGILLHNEGRFAEAVEAFEHAESLGSTQATSNRGNSLLDLNRMSEALEAHTHASALNPNHSGTRYNLALTQLRLGDWQNGWRNYEARWHFREVHRQPRTFHRPRWQGEQLNGQRILLHAEQGLGDTIQFCRYANLVAERGGFPILHVQAPVEHLMHSLNLVRNGRAEVTQLNGTLPSFDCECPMMSLPAIFGTTIDTVPNNGPYLSASNAENEPHTLAFPDGDCGYPRIGISWAGNPRYRTDARRSTTLTTLLPLLQTPGIEWIALQKGEAAKQLSDLPPEIRILDAATHDRDLADTAATIATLDFVITTDTSIAHLAGAMGKPVWILLPHLSDWRWMQTIETTPWYPTARLIRQQHPGDWPGVINRTITALNEQFR